MNTLTSFKEDILLGECHFFDFGAELTDIERLDVFHTLHCVNAVRMALHKDYYNDTRHDDMPHIGK
jgi:mycotoxin biosynthesis protein UstYa